LLLLLLLGAAAGADASAQIGVQGTDTGEWVQSEVAKYSAQFPNSNVMVVCQCQGHQLDTTAQITKFIDTCSSPICGGFVGDLAYDVYIIAFSAGRATLTLKGDGGAINWGFAGHFDRPGNGKTVIFNP
jgi:hypothetical protein